MADALSAEHRLSALPARLTDDEVTRFLGAFDRRLVGGRRDFAMARCLVDLGLRAGEVAALALDDVNWREGTLRIVGGKSRRADLLPLPVPTGRAIVEYLREARPPNTSRALFVRHRAPLDIPIDAVIVRGTVCRALARCGLADRYTGTHVLRHTAAQRMLCGGASLKQVADVLRHRSLDTTAIYTKVDLPRLAAMAAPWPEERS